MNRGLRLTPSDHAVTTGSQLFAANCQWSRSRKRLQTSLSMCELRSGRGPHGRRERLRRGRGGLPNRHPIGTTGMDSPLRTQDLLARVRVSLTYALWHGFGSIILAKWSPWKGRLGAMNYCLCLSKVLRFKRCSETDTIFMLFTQGEGNSSLH